MTQRITEKMIEHLVERINKLAGKPLTLCSEVDGNRVWNPGHYHLNSAYGGHKLVQLCDEGKGIHSITHGYVSKRELYNQLQMILTGMTLRETWSK